MAGLLPPAPTMELQPVPGGADPWVHRGACFYVRMIAPVAPAASGFALMLGAHMVPDPHDAATRVAPLSLIEFFLLRICKLDDDAEDLLPDFSQSRGTLSGNSLGACAPPFLSHTLSLMDL